MNISTFTLFLSGVTTATFSIAGIFFFKLWRASKDRFFLYFATARAGLLALGAVVSLFFPASMEPLATPATEQLVWVYLIRLCAYVSIAAAIYEKNRS